MLKDTFIQAIRDRKKVTVSFYSKEDQRVMVRKCAPMDYGPSRRTKEKNDRYHLWDYNSDTRIHTLSLNPEQVANIEVLDESFEPSEFVTWDTKKSAWFIPRNWGQYS
jgi:hypothetical protein